MQKKLFLKNGIIMASSALAIRILAMYFRIWLSDKIGAEGIGICQLITSVYAFFALICTSGLSVTVTRLAGDQLEKGNLCQAVSLTEKIMLAAVLFSTALGAAMLFSAQFLGEQFLGDIRTVPALRILAPSLPFMSFSSVLRGFFTAERKMLASASEQLIEQLTEICVCMTVFSFFSPNNLTSACLAAVSGTVAAEIVSFVWAAALYLIDIRSVGFRREKVPSLLHRTMPVILPCTASAGLRSSMAAVESMLIPVGLRRFGTDAAGALADYGMISGMAMPVIVFPSVFILPFSTLIITELSRSASTGNKKAINRMSDRMLSSALRYSIPVMILFIFFSGRLGDLLYNSERTGKYIAALAPVVPLMYLDSVIDGMLKGLDKQTSYLICNVIDSVIRLFLTWLLLPYFGVAAVIFIIIFSELLNTSMSLYSLMRTADVRIAIVDDIMVPAICTLIPCLMISLIPTAEFIAPSAELILKIIICAVFYISVLKLSDKYRNNRVFLRSGSRQQPLKGTTE